MRHLGRTPDVKTRDRLLQQTVGVGDAFVLAQVLKPRLHQKRLDEPAFLGGILKHSPAIGTVSAPLARQLIKR